MFFKKNNNNVTYAKKEGDKALGGLVNKAPKILHWSNNYLNNINNPLPGTLGEGKNFIIKGCDENEK
ncbi:hypothetical protein QTH09_17265 [Clostridium perfringens]|nr:hypothetical protein [Clostridium perfringens]